MRRENMENALTEVNDMYITEAARAGEGRKRTRMKKKWIMLPAAILLTAALFVTAGAMTPVDLSFYLKAAFGDGYEMLDGMTAMPDNIAVRSSGDEIRLDLKGIMGDSQVAVAFVDLTVAPGIEVPEERFVIDLKLEPTGLPWEQGLSSYGSSGGYLDRRENEDGSTTFACKLTIRSRDGVMASKYAVKCTGITAMTEDAAEYTSLVEGEWTLAFSLNYKDLTQTIPVDVAGEMWAYPPEILPEEVTEADMVSVPVQVYEVRVSPLSVSVFWKVDAADKALLEGNDITGFAVTMQDGTRALYEQNVLYVKELGWVRLEDDGSWHLTTEDDKAPVSITGMNVGGGTSGHEEPYYGHCILTFDAPLDVENIASVTAGWLEIPLG